MKRVLSILGLVFLLFTAVQAEEGITQIAVFQDGWGNTGSFWEVKLKDANYLVLKISEKEKKGEADIIFDEKLLKEFEENLLGLKKSHNPLKGDGFQIHSKTASGDAIVKTVFARLNGAKFKTIQVTQTKNGQAMEHSLAINKNSYTGLKLGIKKAKRVLKYQ